MTLASTLATMALSMVSAQAACPTTAAAAIAELGPSIRDHAFGGGLAGPGVPRFRSFHGPSPHRLGEPVGYAWVTYNHARSATEVVYRLGADLWTSREAPQTLSNLFRASFPDAQCERSGCFAILSGGGSAVGDLEGSALVPVARVVGGGGLSIIDDDLAAIDEEGGVYPIGLSCRYRFVEAGAPVPLAR